MGEDNASKGLWSSSGIAMACVLILIAAFALRQVIPLIYGSISKTTDAVNEINDSDITMFEGLEVRGSEVIGQINKLKNSDLSVKVITKKSTAYYNRVLTASDTAIGDASGRTTKDAQEITNLYYINKSGVFTGKVIYDSNNTKIGIEFTQK